MSETTGATATPAPGTTTIGSRDLVGQVGASFRTEHSLVVTEAMVLRFAELTGANHWMHIDAARAKASPLGRTTVQGLLTLSLGPLLDPHVLVVESGNAVFYGFDRVRFPAPMFVGDSIRLEIDVVFADEAPDGVRATLRYRFWSSGPKPVCVADQIVHYTH